MPLAAARPLARAARIAGLASGLLACTAGPAAAEAHWQTWDEIVAAAAGQTVFFNAWGGETRINDYIAWAGERVAARYGITLRHVKLTDTAEAVSRVLAEKTAGRDDDGSVDLVWINGENFAAMKDNDLLYGPFTRRLPNYDLVDFADKPTVKVDFTVPVEGLEAPWGMAKFNFIYDSARIAETPGSIAELLAWARAHPGRFTYPAPPDFLGSTFLKQALIGLSPERGRLQEPVGSDAAFRRLTAPLWDYLERLHPHLWRDGEAFPQSGPAQVRLLDDGEVDIALSFHPAQAASLVANDRLPASARTFVLDGGTIGNTHFVAIPYNAGAKAGAMVVANFLLSPAAQARKQDPQVWGDPTVLDLDKLTAGQRALFEAIEHHPAMLRPEELGPTLPEPHPAWMTRIEEAWQRRYSR